MLGIRLEGDPDEARVMLEALQAAGAEVLFGTTKSRGDFSHVYATVRMPDYEAPEAPVRATVVTGGELEPSRRRPRR